MWFRCLTTILPNNDLVKTGTFPSFDPSANPCIIICNHQMDADFFQIWKTFEACGGLGNIKIVLKAELASIPILNMGMVAFDFLFLTRDFDRDKVNLTDHFVSFSEDNISNFGVLIFPEGTTLNKTDQMKCDLFASKLRPSRRPLVSQFNNHLLLPRTNGFETILRALSESGAKNVDVFDYTLIYEGYRGEVPTYEMGYDRERDNIPSLHKITGHDGLAGLPRVHVHSEKFTAKSILGNGGASSSSLSSSSSPSVVETWLDQQWIRKGERIQNFVDEKNRHGVTTPPRQLSENATKFTTSELAKMGVICAAPMFAFVASPLLVICFGPLVFWVQVLAWGKGGGASRA